MFFAVMRCKGLSISVSLLPPSLPFVNFDFEWPPAEQCDLIGSERQLYASPYLAVATPPPDARVL